MIVLSKEQIKRLHQKMLEATGGSDGIREEMLLDSALSASFQTFDGRELYPSTVAKIARITCDIIRNHPFVDGNKRTGIYVMMILLELNDIQTAFTDDDIIRIGLDIADGKMDDKQLLDLILNRNF